MTTTLSLNTIKPFYPYHANFAKEMGLIGVATIMASVLYFVAANWFWWSPTWQMGLMMGLFATIAITSAFVRHALLRQSLHTVVAGLVGLNLAVIGQVYQTGADSFWLFALWSVLLLPWFFWHNTGVYFVRCVISHLALWLFFEQVMNSDGSLGYLLVAHALAITQLIMANKFYPKARLLVVLILSLLSFVSANFTRDYHTAFLSKIIAFALMVGVPLWASLNFRRQGHQLATALMLSGFGVSVSVFVLIHWGFGGFGDLFVLGALILAWFFVLGHMMVKFFPKGNFHHILTTLGAWLSGLIFAIAMLVFWDSFSMVLGFASFVSALWLLKAAAHRHFVQQFAHCLMLAGQLAFLVHLEDKTDSVLVVLLAQAAILAAVLFLRLPWLVIFYHVFALYALSCMYFVDMADWLTNTPSMNVVDGIGWLFLMPFILLNFNNLWVNFYARAILLLTPSVIAATVVQKSTAWDTLAVITFQPQLAWTEGIWLLVFLGSFYHQNKNLAQIALFGTLGFVLMFLGYFELFVLLLGLIWTNTHNDKVVQGLYLTSIGLYLWQIYYSLEISFLLKSSTMLVVGLIFLIIARHLYRTANALSSQGELQ